MCTTLGVRAGVRAGVVRRLRRAARDLSYLAARDQPRLLRVLTAVREDPASSAWDCIRLPELSLQAACDKLQPLPPDHPLFHSMSVAARASALSEAASQRLAAKPLKEQQEQERKRQQQQQQQQQLEAAANCLHVLATLDQPQLRQILEAAGYHSRQWIWPQGLTPQAAYIVLQGLPPDHQVLRLLAAAEAVRRERQQRYWQQQQQMLM